MTRVILAGDAEEFDRRFSEILLMSVEEGVVLLLGEEVMRSLFFYMEKFSGLSRDEIPCRLDDFFAALVKAFGPISGKTIGRFIFKVLYAKLGLEFVSKPNCALSEYADYARRKLIEEK